MANKSNTGKSNTGKSNTARLFRTVGIPLLKIALFALVFGWIAFELYRSWGTLAKFQWRPQVGWLCVAALAYVAASLPAATFWGYLLRLFGQQATPFAIFRAYQIGHLGKYTPGKAMVVVLRAGLIKASSGVRASVAAAAVFYETFTMMATGSLLATLIIGTTMTQQKEWGMLTGCSLAMLLLTGSVTLPPLFRYVVIKLGVGRDDEAVTRGLHRLGVSTLGWGVLAMTFNWLLMGVSLWATIKGIGLEVDGSLAAVLPRFTAAMALSVVLGFVAMLPGGIGVREWALALLLTSYFAGFGDAERQNLPPETIGIIVAAAQRVVTIVAELVFAACLFKMRK